MFPSSQWTYWDINTSVWHKELSLWGPVRSRGWQNRTTHGEEPEDRLISLPEWGHKRCHTKVRSKIPPVLPLSVPWSCTSQPSELRNECLLFAWGVCSWNVLLWKLSRLILLCFSAGPGLVRVLLISSCTACRTAGHLQWLHHLLSRVQFTLPESFMMAHSVKHFYSYLFTVHSSGFYKHIFFPVYLVFDHIEPPVPFPFSPSFPFLTPTSLPPFPSPFSVFRSCVYMSLHTYTHTCTHINTVLYIHIMRRKCRSAILNLACLP